MTKKRVAWSKKVEEFVLDKMIELKKVPAKIFEIYSKDLPGIKSHERALLNNPEYRDRVNTGYSILYEHYHSEYDDVSSKTPIEYYIQQGKVTAHEDDGSPKIDFRDASGFHRERLGALKFQLGTLAGILTKKYAKATRLEIEGNVQQKVTFVIPDFLKGIRQEDTAKVIDASDFADYSEE